MGVSGIIGEKGHWRELADHEQFQAELDRDEAVLLYAELMKECEELLAEYKAAKVAARIRENTAEFKSKAAAAPWFAKLFGFRN